MIIDRKSAEYNHLKYKVKIGHAFLEKGHDIRGVVHIGANDGYEVEFYLALGIEKIICFEPLPSACELFKKKYAKEIADGRVRLFEYGIGHKDAKLPLHVGYDTGQTSTFLRVNNIYKDVAPFRDTERGEEGNSDIVVEIKTWDTFVRENISIDFLFYDCLVCDVQGMELEVLKSIFGSEYQEYFDFINVECSKVPVFVGESSAQEVCDYLTNLGFNQDTPIEDHNDIMFTRKNLLIYYGEK